MIKYCTLLLTILCFNCSAQSTVKKQNTENERSTIVKEQLGLTKKEYKAIKQKDSVIMLLHKNIESNVSIALIKKRLDSFLLNSYSRKLFFVTLELDRAFKYRKTPYEFNANGEVPEHQKANLIEDLKAYHNAFVEGAKQSLRDKNDAIQEARKKKNEELNIGLALTETECEAINEQGLTTDLYDAYKDSVSPTLIRRRLDSFLLKSYSYRDFSISLQIDRRLKDYKVPFEFNRNEDPYKYSSIDEWVKAYKDSIN